MKIWVLRPTVRCGSNVLGSAARPIFTSPVGAARAGAPMFNPAAAVVTPRRRRASRRVSVRRISLDMWAPLGPRRRRSGAGPAALDLDDDVAKRLRADVAQRVSQGALIPAHDRAGLHLDAVDRAVGVRALDQVALDDHRRVVEIVGVPAGHFARRQLDSPDSDAVVLVYQLGSDRIALRIRGVVSHIASRLPGAKVAQSEYHGVPCPTSAPR